MPITNGPDNIVGTDLDDTIDALGGDDRINALRRPTAPGSGIDTVDGGSGRDTLVVDASGEAQSVQLSVNGPANIYVRSTSGNYYIDAYNMERVEFTGGGGDDSILTHSFGGAIAGGAGIDHWTSDFSEQFANIVFHLGTTTAIAPAGLTSITGIDRITMATGAGNDRVTGGVFGDSIVTGDGDDIIDPKSRSNASGAPIDHVNGGEGFDRLIVNASTSGTPIQVSTSGNSVYVRSDSGLFYLDSFEIEELFVTGGAGNDVLETGSLQGRVIGGGGIDTWQANLSALTTEIVFKLGVTTSIAAAGLTQIGGLERLVLTTGSGDDTITGGVQGDTINTGAGNDIIAPGSRQTTGGAPIDVVDAGGGNDTLVVAGGSDAGGIQLSSNGTSVFVRSNTGKFYIDATSIEMIDFTGGAGNDSIQTLEHGGAIDGGGGRDQWNADFSGHLGNLTLQLGVTTALPGVGITEIARVESLVFLSGAGNDVLTGGIFGDVINGGNGNDIINPRTRDSAPGSSIDTVYGGNGTDTLIINAAAELTSVDLTFSGPSSFFVRSASGIHYVDAYEFEMVRFTGGGGNDNAAGGLRNDVLTGNGGNDQFFGDSGMDTLNGGAGNDVLTGGRAADSLTGGPGADRFVYRSVLDSRVAAGTSDTITDLVVGEDEIDLTQIDADNNGLNGNQAFTFIGGAAFTGVAGQLRSISGRVEGDVTGDGIADFLILLGNNAVATVNDLLL